ncbi:hypothetical protein M8C21_022386 [Ambrosia artemisiifolia]|uniref:Bulb-type lectin domain-containing protein n=1 Tax=Ambrosia artemisiifolia TaxID=4212 RepID=A0AAD5C6V0_AMBAR|nr:hypothetical protein M8C21_022386 [Ambrosia artemisiifolia]
MRTLTKLLFFSIALFSALSNSAAVDTITGGQALIDNDTIVSSNEMYELGFFSPGNSKNRYLGIWFKKIYPQTVVWVANRETPLTGTKGVLRVNSNGMLLLFSGNNTMICSTDQDFIWQSFDYPTDTLLAGMKFGKDLVTGLDRHLTSWKSMDDPSPGLYVSWMDTNGYPQAFERRGSVLRLRFGPWTGVSSIMSRVYLTPEGNEMRLNYIDPTQGWMPYLVTTVDMCTQYGLCGAYGICNINTSPACTCTEGFQPRYPVQWNAGNWSGGCKHEKPLNCGNANGFKKLSGVKLPDTRHSWYDQLNKKLQPLQEHSSF